MYGRHRVMSFEPRLREIERGRRDVDEPHGRGAAPARGRGEQQIQLLAVAAAELDDLELAGQRVEDRGAAPLEQRALGAPDPVPRQAADRFEERGAEIVVEPARRQRPRRARESVGDVAREGGDERIAAQRDTVRKPAYT